jgi:tRNA threonylcarbamoyl adenosine modification protein YeaZ
MYTLVFDTTAKAVILGLYKGTSCVAKVEEFMEFGQAESLAVKVGEVLDKEGISFDEVGLLGVGVGPGSFTGVRASLAFAKALGFARTDLLMTGVSSFEVYKEMLDEKNRAFYNAVVIETKREDFYFQLFDENMNKLTEPLALTREEIRDKIKARQVSFIGDGVERLLSVSMGLQIKTVELTEMLDVQHLFEAVYKKYLEKSLDFPKPMYIRNADACVK